MYHSASGTDAPQSHIHFVTCCTFRNGLSTEGVFRMRDTALNPIACYGTKKQAAQPSMKVST